MIKKKLYLSALIIVIAAFAVWLLFFKHDSLTKRGAVLKTPEQEMVLANRLSGMAAKDLKQRFPYKDYSLSANPMRMQLLSKDLYLMDSLYPQDKYLNYEVLSDALTTKGQLGNWCNTNLDSLDMLLSWSEKLLALSELEDGHAFVFKSVANYWCGEVANQLTKAYEKEQFIRYKFKFRMLEERCARRQCGVATTPTAAEKVIKNVVEQQWHYLIIDRFWNTTSWFFKLLLLLPFLIVFYSFFVTYKYHKR